jgi:hypothetical protein
LKSTKIGSLSPSPQRERAGGEGIDRGVLSRYADLKYPVELKI